MARQLPLLLLFCLAAGTHAASLESLVMPGPVAAAHAETEEECSACHAPFSKASQSSLCLDCHQDIVDDFRLDRGLHGTDPALETRECRGCHGEHRGRDADILGLVPEAFDHTRSGFELTGHHARALCQDCHQPDEPFRDAAAECHACHAADDLHRGNLGTDCAACHSPVDWTEHGFSHDRDTGFALHGAHGRLTCGACHADQSYDGTPTQCAACHALDDVHQGSRGSDCGSCHDEQSWTAARFDHRTETGFELEGAHAMVPCSGCHLDAMALTEPPTECAGCHSADDPHRGQRGGDCAACHGQASWEVRFDHGQQTGFELLGGHALLACEDCHRGSLETPLPSDCEGCHRNDDPHGGTLTACTDCHEPHGWRERLRFDHEFTTFPLLGMHRLAACEQCHLTLDFHQAASACRDCHSDEDVHGGTLGDDCSSCHTPNAWTLWRFDHGRQTGFDLTGAHQGLACDGCHAPGQPMTVSSSCDACHRQDDVHRGQFGSQCERCHTTATFAEPRRMF